MSLQLTTVVRAARDRHPAFHKSRVPDAVIGRFLSDFQNELIGEAIKREPQYLAQSVAIALDLDSTNQPGTVGAGTSGGLPGEIVNGTPNVVEESAGSLVEIGLSGDDGGTVIVPERHVTAATANTVSSTGAARTTNQDAGKLAYISGGMGFGQVRAIASNTATQWTVTQNWTVTPDTTSLVTIIAATTLIDEESGVVTAIPALSTRRGYLVRINSSGAPYLDYTAPLAISVMRGLPLPSMLAPVGGTVRYTDSDEEPLVLTTFNRRYDPPGMPAAYVVGEELFLVGEAEDWTDAVSIELRYVPIAPEFAALTDYFLVPDAARPALVANASAFMARRVNGLDGISLNVADFVAEADRSLARYLGTLRVGVRGRITQSREAPY